MAMLMEHNVGFRYIWVVWTEWATVCNCKNLFEQ